MKHLTKRACLILITLILLLLVAAFPAYAASGPSGSLGVVPGEPCEDDDISWKLAEDGTLTVSGVGAMENYVAASETPWASKASQIKAVVFTEGVTSVGKYAFQGCANLTTVTFSETLAQVGGYAFDGCGKLATVNLPSKQMVIGPCAFTSTDIQNINAPNITAWMAFSSELYDYENDRGFNLYLNGKLTSDLEIPEGVTSIPATAFYYCQTLEQVRLPASLKTIGVAAFSGCSNLEIVYMPDSLTSIGSSAFKDCIRLRGITIPQGITAIPSSAFEGCSNLSSISIRSADMKAVEEDAFFGCGKLKEIYLFDLAAWINSSPGEILSANSLDKKLYLNGSPITNLQIPQGVTSIPNRAFAYCSAITSVTVPDGVTTIGANAFQACSGLKSIYFKGSAPAVAGTAFTGVTADCFYYRNASGWSAFNKGSYGGTLRWADATLATPQVTISNDAATGKPLLKWDAVEGAVGYKVYRATAKNGTYTLMKNVTDTSYINKIAEAEVGYYYKVRAIAENSNANSAYSEAVYRTCDLEQPVVTVSNDAATGKPLLKWDAVEGAVSYKVYRATTKNGTYTLMKNVTGTSYVNKIAEAETGYYYKVRAIAENTNANSAYSAVVSRTCDLAQPVITVSNDAATGKPLIQWEPVEGAVLYKVYRATSQNGTYTLMKNVTGTSMVNKNAVAKTKYFYKVRAIAENTNANSAYSAIVSRTCDLPQPKLVSSLNSSGKPVVDWDAVPGAVEYKIYIYNADGTLNKTLITSYTKLVHKAAVAGKTYSYQVAALAENSGANSAKSASVRLKAK